MYAHEAEAKWAAEKAVLMAEWTPLEREKKQDLIVRAMDYKSGPDSCNSVYLGSMARHSTFMALGSHITRGTLIDALAKATDAQLNAALDVCANVIRYMLENPRTTCPTCGGIVPAKKEA